jgi:hypothetical protein
MKIDKRETVEIKLVLTKEEAKWLMEACQNPINKEETIKDEDIRIAFFKNIKEILNK